MTDQWNNRTGVQDPPNSRNERWLRRPRRSTGDRKIAGVAGGLGRAFGIDPVLIRVAFVVLTIFGGVGGLLYVLGWLLLPADGDEVSAAESLLGRGRSSVPPVLAVGLVIVAVISAFSMFSWGLPFLPLAVGGLIVLAIMRRRGRLHHGEPARDGRHPRGHWENNQWQNGDWMQRTDDQVRAWSERAERWSADVRRSAQQGRGPWGACGSRGGWGGWSGWGGSGNAGEAQRPAGPAADEAPRPSPFEQPAFWEQPGSGRSSAGGKAADRSEQRVDTTVDMTKERSDRTGRQNAAGTTTRGATTGAGADDLLGADEPRTTPPAWDPLGVAPFAWDLPEPTPLPQPPAPTKRSGGVISRVALGAALIIGGLSAAGVFAGWWALTWAQVSGLALGILALGLLFSALRGRGYSLIGPGVFLSLVTMALAVTGVSGTTGYGSSTFHPTSLGEVQSTYQSNAGDLDVDLSSIKIPKDTTKDVTVDLKGGHAQVEIPSGVNVVATCETRVGHADCLGVTADGVDKQATQTITGHADSGTLNLHVKVNAGFAEVSTGA